MITPWLHFLQGKQEGFGSTIVCRQLPSPWWSLFNSWLLLILIIYQSPLLLSIISDSLLTTALSSRSFIYDSRKVAVRAVFLLLYRTSSRLCRSCSLPHSAEQQTSLKASSSLYTQKNDNPRQNGRRRSCRDSRCSCSTRSWRKPRNWQDSTTTKDGVQKVYMGRFCFRHPSKWYGYTARHSLSQVQCWFRGLLCMSARSTLFSRLIADNWDRLVQRI